MTRLPEITVRGGAAERGMAYGVAARGQIASALDTYRGFFKRRGVTWAEAMLTAAEFRAVIEAQSSDAAEEIEAIGKGSGQGADAITLLNARTEILYWRMRKAEVLPADGADECSGVIVCPKRSLDGTLLHAQNWDWMPEAADHTVALRILDHDGPNALHFVEAGQLARHGMNAAGLAISAMGLHSDRDYGRLGLPSPVLRRQMIHSGSLGEAIGLVYGSDPSFSHALAASDADGAAVILESAPGLTEWLMPKDGVLTHTNHFKSDPARTKLVDINLARCPDSLVRDQRLMQLLATSPMPIDREAIQAALMDTAHCPGSLMRAPAARPGGLTSATLYSLIMEPALGRAWLALRPYQGTHFEEYKIAP
ncbi:C45 family autoproteolytic acyltransferase/hydolase [Nitratireductor pacificus]|uniref:Peptidase C45 acyl-coenzyme A:6-aminopenicillanic acid acyl-transferase n=1 Tax=Nitratireductor pacificus pht-3B TaxID=391937 RepID=K2M7Y2_9HYPH|nr:C45 family peptidase [Nitratireductor pacificus]EKF18316.1 peptidase C45 acyl-coenzyme A:6-aminopenicillanic acid acyl-transferase [Nitratireductor pacificus pht-3B]